MWWIHRLLINFGVRRLLFNWAPSRGSIRVDPAKWKEALARPAPAWMLDRIRRDLAPFSSGLSEEWVDRAIPVCARGAFPEQYVRVRVRHGIPAFETPDPCGVRFRAIRAGLQHLMEIVELPDLDMVVSLSDGIKREQCTSQDAAARPLPVFAFARDVRAEGAVLQPDFCCFSGRCASYAWLTHLLPAARDAALKIPWRNRRPVAFWRGATTNIEFEDPKWEEKSARCRLCRLSLAHPDLIDARFAYLTRMTPARQRYVLANYPFARFQPIQDAPFKYQISVEGTTCPYPGLQTRLACGAAVVKQETASVQWFYDALQPWVHYIPVRDDLEDLIDAVRWTREHDEDAHAVARRGMEFVDASLSAEPIYLYWWLLLREYVGLFRQR